MASCFLDHWREFPPFVACVCDLRDRLLDPVLPEAHALTPGCRRGGTKQSRNYRRNSKLHEKRSGRRKRPKPRTGVYYWLPTTFLSRVTWQLFAGHDLGYDSEAEHYSMWPVVVDRLADPWQWSPRFLRRCLEGCEAALPRGRVDRSAETGRFVIRHGDDAPDPYWRCMVIDRFGLEGRFVNYAVENDYRRLDPDVRRLEVVLGVDTSSLVDRPPSWLERGFEGQG